MLAGGLITPTPPDRQRFPIAAARMPPRCPCVRRRCGRAASMIGTCPTGLNGRCAVNPTIPSSNASPMPPDERPGTSRSMAEPSLARTAPSRSGVAPENAVSRMPSERFPFKGGGSPSMRERGRRPGRERVRDVAVRRAGRPGVRHADTVGITLPERARRTLDDGPVIRFELVRRDPRPPDVLRQIRFPWVEAHDPF